LAAGFKDAAEVIFGDVKGVTTIGLHSGESVEVFGEKIYKTLADYDENDLLKFCNTALNKSFIYNTLKHVIKFNIKFILIE